MGSPAATRFEALAQRASIILSADRSDLDRDEMQALYGAAFVAQVAAWNAYVPALVTCFFREVSNPLNPNFHAMHALAEAAAGSQVDRFNTPNAENTRSLILGSTGYDPWTDWQWTAIGMNALATRLRLNEILKVRHSLAHGFSMPGFQWTQTAAGRTRLTVESLRWTRRFLNHLVGATDLGLKSHLVTTYRVSPGW